MNGFQPWMQHMFPMTQPNGEDQYRAMLQRNHPMMGGNLPPQGYDSSGINPHGMYTGGPMPAYPGGMQMGGALPPQAMPQMQTGGNLPAQGMFAPRPMLNTRGFNFFGGQRPPSMGTT